MYESRGAYKKYDSRSQNAIARGSAKLNEHMSANDVTRLTLKSAATVAGEKGE